MTVPPRPEEIAAAGPASAEPAHPASRIAARLRDGRRRWKRPALPLRSGNKPVPISVRYYIVPESGPLRHIPTRVADGLHTDADLVPEFADTRQRVVQIVIENRRGKSVRLLDVTGHYWAFDGVGRVAPDHEWMRFAFERPAPTTGRVVDIRPQLERAQWKARTRWEVTGEVLDQVVAAVWPGKGVAAEAVRAVMGRAPKRPRLTHEGRDAMRELSILAARVGGIVENLGEPALRGLAYEFREYEAVYEGEAVLWAALAAMAERQRAILAQRRSGRGVWYACVRLWRLQDPLGYDRHEVETVEERCEGRAAAEAAAQRMLATHAHRFAADVTIEAEVVTELEWTPLRREATEE